MKPNGGKRAKRWKRKQNDGKEAIQERVTRLQLKFYTRFKAPVAATFSCFRSRVQTIIIFTVRWMVRWTAPQADPLTASIVFWKMLI